MFYYLISDASYSNACACNTCDCCEQSHHLTTDADAWAWAACANHLDANDLTIRIADIDRRRAFNTPSPIIRRNKKATSLLDDSSTTATKQTRSKLAQHRKSWSESDLLNEIDNALVFSKGFLYAYGK